MLYERSMEIERRLEEVLHLIRTGKHSTPSLAKTLDVSVPTVSRCLLALRERGHDIKPIRGPEGWHYVLMPEKRPAKQRRHHHPFEAMSRNTKREDKNAGSTVKG